MKKSLFLRLLSNFSELAKKSQTEPSCPAQKLTLVRTKASAETIEQRLLFSAAPFDGGLGSLFAQQNAATIESSVSNAELVVIDTRIDGLNTIIDDLNAQQAAGRNLSILLINADDDAVVQISDRLSQGQTYASIHIVSHGTAGDLQLGRNGLNTNSIAVDATLIAGWSNALTDNADIRLYGCDFASTAIGQKLLGTLASLTGADLAASSDTTGHATLNANWELEVQTGKQEASNLISKTAQKSWNFKLDGPANVGPAIIIDAAGTTTGSILLAPTFSGASNTVAIARNNLGNSLVIWRQIAVDDASTVTGYGQLVDASNNLVGLPFEIHTQAGIQQDQFTVAALADDGFIVLLGDPIQPQPKQAALFGNT